MSQTGKAIWLAWRDWKFERTLSLCAVLALASMLAPILILQGIKNGVTGTMRERLLEDPATLVITPKSDAGRFTPAFIADLAKLDGAAYAVGRTRETAADLTLANPDAGKRVPIALEPATAGEPLLKKYGAPCPSDGAKPQIVLSATAAATLGVKAGASLDASLSRRTPQGRLESTPLVFQVAFVLPIAAADRRIGFVPLTLLEAMEDYRDNYAVPGRGFTGAPRQEERKYASFRLYARELDDVGKLAAKLADMNIETMTKARDIAAIKSLESAINKIMLIVSAAVGAGFAAFMFSFGEGAIRRKKRMLGMLRLLGFERGALLCYPLFQSLLTAVCGFALSLLLFYCVAAVIRRAFAGLLSCSLGPVDISAALAIVILLALFSTSRASWQAASMEPSSVIREV